MDLKNIFKINFILINDSKNNSSNMENRNNS